MSQKVSIEGKFRLRRLEDGLHCEPLNMAMATLDNKLKVVYSVMKSLTSIIERAYYY